MENDEDYFNRKLEKIRELSSDKTLIVIDNFDTESDIKLSEVLEGNYKIIFTTRNDFSLYKYPIIKIDVMSDLELLDIFKNNYLLPIDNEENILKIINLVGRHTLTTTLIASIMRENRIKVVKMIENLSSNEINIKGLMIHNNKTYDSLYSCLSNVFKVSNLTKDEKLILSLLSLFSIDGVSFDDFLDLSSFDDAFIVNSLIKKSIISYNVVTDYISLHPINTSVVEKEMKIT